MRKFRVNTDPSKVQPSPAQIKRYKDFDALSHNYERLAKRPRKPLYKDPKMFIFLMLLGLIALLLFSA